MELLKKIIKKKEIIDICHDHTKLLLITVFTLGILFRLLGVQPGFNPYHPDEGKAGYSSAWYMFSNRTLDLPHYNYPALIPTIELIFLVMIFIPLMWIKFIIISFPIVSTHLNQLPNYFPNLLMGTSELPFLPLVYWSRYLTVFFSILVMYLTYLCGKRLFSFTLAATFSVLILAVNFRAIFNSQLDLPDTYNSFFLLLVFLSILMLKDSQFLKNHIFVGVTEGLFISSKLQFFGLLPWIVVSFFLAFQNGKTIFQKISYFFSIKFLLSLLFMFITVIVVNIGPLTHFTEFRETISYEAYRYGIGILRFHTIAIAYFYQIVLTPWVFFVAILGLMVGFKKNLFSTVLILSVILPYLFYFLYYTEGGFFPRNFTSIIPFVALFAGLGLSWCWGKIKKFTLPVGVKAGLMVAIVSIIIFESVKNSLIHTFYYLKPWSLTSMRECVSQNVKENTTIASHPWDKHILFSLPETDKKKGLKFIPLNVNQSYSLAELQQIKADYILVGFDELGYANSSWWMADKELHLWEKPKDVARNTFASLAALELFNYSICSEVKPWQAPDNNYILARVPVDSDFKKTEVISHTFDDSEVDLKNWKTIDGFLGVGDNLLWDIKEGKKKKGSIKILVGHAPYPVVRWISPTFLAKEENVYQAEAWIKSKDVVSKENRNGFLRLDFYQYYPALWNEGTVSLSTSLSARYYGSSEWQKLKVIGEAPANTRFATISFQVANPASTTFWFDDLVIYRINEQTNSLTRQSNEKKAIIDDDVLIPNLGGGF